MAEYNLLDAEEILSKYGLVAFDLKHQLNTIHNAFDKIDARFRQVINKGSVDDYIQDQSTLIIYKQPNVDMGKTLDYLIKSFAKL